MIQFLLRCDDLGYSEAVNYGIEKALRFGMAKSTGMMPNMPAAAHGFALVRNLPICVGQHTNICVGPPVCDPRDIPSLVQANGAFKPSRAYRAAEEDIVVLEEAVREIEAQYQRFKELTGREPAYFEGHAVRSANFDIALELVAKRHGLKYSGMVRPGQTMPVGTGQAYRCAVDSMNPDYDAVESLQKAVQEARTDMPNLYVCHPGYVDDYLLRTSSLTLNRAKEAEMLSEPSVRAWLEEQQVELVSYDDIGN